MITVEEALSLVAKYAKPLAHTEIISLEVALGRLLASAVHSPIDMPPFRQSAMDGYAVRLGEGLSYDLMGEVQAGSGQQIPLQPQQAVRIFTGAPVPDDADAVIMQEKTHQTNGQVHLQENPKPQANIRPKGEQIQQGNMALPKNHLLSPASMGFLVTLGISEVEVYQLPKIQILVTGNELAQRGQPLAYGQIYESNGLMLQQSLQAKGFPNTPTTQVSDDYTATLSALNKAISQSDMVLVSGGISVGDYDFVGKALEELGVEQVFYKVRQKPGKPLFFGKKGDCLIFALPGNPASALSCCHAYVLPALQVLAHRGNFKWSSSHKKLSTSFLLKGDRAQFLKAKVVGENVEILSGQSSAMLSAFSEANALAYIRLGRKEVKQGEEVEVLWL